MKNIQVPITCPCCRRSTTNLKQYKMVAFCLFLLIGFGMQNETVTACPRCMRKHILFNALFNIIPANIVWLVFLLPHYAILAIDTYTAGHSKPIQEKVDAILAREAATV